MKFKLVLFIIVYSVSFSIVAQENPEEKKDTTLEGQFVDVIDKSGNYQDYKVIKKLQLATLRKNILDTVAGLEKNINTANGTIEKQKNRIADLENSLKSTDENLTTAKEKENKISFLGSNMTKSSYNTLMWGIITALLLGLAFFIFKFKNSNTITKEANLKLSETEKEFELYRQKKLEEVQQIRRKLQDEINKNRKANL